MYERMLFNLEHNYVFFDEDAQRQAELMLSGKYSFTSIFHHDLNIFISERVIRSGGYILRQGSG